MSKKMLEILKGLAVGDRVKVVPADDMAVPSCVKGKPVTIIGISKDGNVICDLGGHGTHLYIPRAMLEKEAENDSKI